MKRFFDFNASLFLILLLTLPMILVATLIVLTSGFPVIFWSKRVGKNNSIFLMPKFRTMFNKAPDIATHLLKNPERHITPIGRILRKTSIDELPQLFSVLSGKMSIVGPRPAHISQLDLISLRTKKKIDELAPGITGLAQINGRDEISIDEKVVFDEIYLKSHNFWFDMKIIIKTILSAIRAKGVSH